MLKESHLGPNRISEPRFQLALAPHKLPRNFVLGTQRMSLQILPSDTLAQVMDKLERKTGFPVGLQRLYSQAVVTPERSMNRYRERRFAILLDDVGQSASDLGLQAGTALELLLLQPRGSLLLFVVDDVSGQTLSMQAAPDDLIRQLSIEIFERTRQHPRRQMLSFDGQTLADPMRTLAEYGIKPGATLVLAYEELEGYPFGLEGEMQVIVDE